MTYVGYTVYPSADVSVSKTGDDWFITVGNVELASNKNTIKINYNYEVDETLKNLTYNVINENGNNSIHCVYYIKAGDPLIVPEMTPRANPGYHFDGWEMPVSQLMPNDDLTINGRIVEDVPTYTLTYKVDGSTYETQRYVSGALITLPTAPTKAHHQFTGWLNMPQDMLMPSNNLTVTAQFTEDPKYTVTYEYE